MFCKKCGALLNDECRVCPVCDTPTINYVKAAFDTAPAPRLQPETPPASEEAFAADGTQPGEAAAQNGAENTQYSAPATPLYAPMPVRTTADDSTVGTAQFFLYRFLFSLPIAGLFIAIYTAFSANSNLNLRNYARATLIWYAVGIGVAFFISITIVLLAFSVNWMYW